VMRRSRMWPLMWVGKLTCWTRLIEERSLRESDVQGSEGMSIWILKSPVRRNSWGVVAARESRQPSSSRKTDCAGEYSDESGGR
jgi:hypothetical protein